VKGFDLWSILSNQEYIGMLIHGIEMTFVIFLGSWSLAMSLALILLCIRFSPFRFGDRVVAAYVSYHRNVPTLVQLMLWYFGIFTLLPSGLTNWLSGMSGTSVIILGIVLGLMMCFDLGGPVNKAAYAFATAGLNVADPASLRIMAAVMAAGMVPPLAMALASTIRPGLFTEPERENGRAAWLLGASFISEGAIPFAAADPLRVIPSMMFGGAITGALIMAFGVTQKAPHGGIFVFFAINPILWFLVALAAGTVVGALAVIAAKQFVNPKAEEEANAAFAAA